ncbi:MAG TPA: extracellular solute-binding protein [Firmicutes bacterium]|nr:extracellular solute-binding protein [Bacillota bacterium]
MRRWFAAALAGVVCLSSAPAAVCARAEGLDEPEEVGGGEGYAAYLERYADAERPGEAIIIPAADFTETEGEAELHEGPPEGPAAAVYTDDEGYIEWQISVPRAGLYALKLRYIQIPGRSASIERAVSVNGALPYEEAGKVVLKRLWRDAEPGIRQDASGNDLRPIQEEYPVWQETFLYDDMGYFPDPLLFYFQAGTNTIRLTAVREPLGLAELCLCQPAEAPDYADYRARFGVSSSDSLPLITVQGEDMFCKSDPVLGPTGDRSSPSTQPYSVSKIRLNTVGGSGSWNTAGQFIAWRFSVEEEGDYAISIKCRQNISRDLFSSRRVYLDGEIPFRELSSVKFTYSSRWEMVTLGQEGVPYLFHLTPGIHELRLQAVLGDMGPILSEAEDCLYQLNALYRDIMMVTGAVPDYNREYGLETLIPGAIEGLGTQAQRVRQIIDRLLAYTGERGTGTALLDTLYRQLVHMSEYPEDIPRLLENYKSNLGAMGTWLLEARQQPLEIDYFCIASPGEPLPRAQAGFGAQFLHEVRTFFASFAEDYNSLTGTDGGVPYINEEPVRIWVTSGRDQGQIIKRLLDDTFSASSRIRTKLELVQSGVLLSATVAGTGPDVALSVGGTEPVNYAIRHAVCDLSAFSDFEETASRFHPEAMVPYRYDGGVYALPETQTFPMLFYREDLLKELELKVPETWEDVVAMVPVLAKSGMSFALPVSSATASGAGVGSYYALLLQSGGKVYLPDGTASALDSDTAVAAFRKWTNFYRNYGFPLSYDFINRFRTGETPVGVADFTTYNTLLVSAPEIRGLWGFTQVPGTVRDNGAVDHSVAGGGTACMILAASHQPENAWEFLKWWTDAETQERFSSELESLLGASARYPTANLEAFSSLPWTADEYRQIQLQRSAAKGIEEIPGSYFTPRHLDNAFRKVVYDAADPKDTLLDYVYTINREILAKREEYGLTGGEKGE